MSILSFLHRKPEPIKAPNLFREMEVGNQAQAFLDSPCYERVMGKLREGIHTKWAGSPIADKDGQHELRLMLKILDDFDANLRAEATTGKMAAIQIERTKK